MTPMIDGDTVENTPEARANEQGVGAVREVSVQSDRTDTAPVRVPIPWIGALSNPRLGPLVVVDDNGYLVPLWTAGDLLRGCRCFWASFAGINKYEHISVAGYFYYGWFATRRLGRDP